MTSLKDKVWYCDLVYPEDHVRDKDTFTHNRVYREIDVDFHVQQYKEWLKDEIAQSKGNEELIDYQPKKMVYHAEIGVLAKALRKFEEEFE